MIDVLATALCDPGEVGQSRLPKTFPGLTSRTPHQLIFIPTPYFNFFTDDLSGKARVEVLNGIVPEGAHGELGEIQALEETLEEIGRAHV